MVESALARKASTYSSLAQGSHTVISTSGRQANTVLSCVRRRKSRSIYSQPYLWQAQLLVYRDG